MANDIKVSVICLAYNHGKYIREALEGFVNQKTNFKYEVIVHDDASLDNTAQIIKEYQQNYPEIIKPIFQTENQYSKGVKVLANAVKFAKGEFLAFCEGDDYWIDENKLQMQYDVMKKNPGVVFCAHKVQCVNEDMSMNERVIPSIADNIKEGALMPEEYSLRIISGRYLFHTSSYFVYKWFFDSEERDLLATKMNGDNAILHSVILHGKAYYIDKIMSHRRLMTIGNWNQRFKSFSEDKKLQYYLRQIDARILFDEISKFKYHKHILYCNYKSLTTEILKDKNNQILRTYFKDYKRKYKFNWFISLKFDIYYILFNVAPGLLKKLIKR